jgi:hypothetical protein
VEEGLAGGEAAEGDRGRPQLPEPVLRPWQLQRQEVRLPAGLLRPKLQRWADERVDIFTIRP